MDRPPHAGLRHLALNVRSLDEMKRFYVDLLGFTIEWEPDPDNVYLSSGIDNLALHRPAEASPSDVADVSRLRSPESDASSPPSPAEIDERQASARSRRSSSQSDRTEADGEARHSAEGATAARDSALDHLGLIVRSADDVDRWAAFLESHGVVIDARPRTHRDGARSCYFRDPDGNHVQIIHHPPISHRV
jgi:catechol 2,3-dioxygenase-like lactoylglutathione lyase family enzyme